MNRSLKSVPIGVMVLWICTADTFPAIGRESEKLSTEAVIDGNFYNTSSGTYFVELGARSHGGLEVGSTHNGGLHGVAVDGPLPHRSGCRITGLVTLAGTLRVELENGLAPKLGDRFLLMTYQERHGQ